MPKFRLSRRAVLRGAGTVAVALPWLEAMGTGRRAHAAAPALAQRFVTVYTPGGTLLDKWRPTGTETAFVPNTILKPLEPLKHRLLVLDGVDMRSARGEQHQAGIVAWLTGTPQSSTYRNYASGPSIDQVIANRISVGKKKKGSLQIAIRWATGKSRGRLHPINAANFEDNATFRPIPPRLDPVEIWRDLFGTIGPGAALGGGDAIARKRSILDYVGKRYGALSKKLGAADRRTLEQHLTKIREIENGLTAVTGAANARCAAPTLVDTSDYNPTTGLMSSDNGSIRDVSTDAAIPKVGRLMMDMIVMALACDLTAVASLQWSDTEAKHTFPWLDLREHHHFYQHDGGFRPRELEKIYIWYSEMHLHLLGAMDRVDMGGHSLLDESVVFFGSELQAPSSHGKTNMPFLLAGGGGGLRSGRWAQYPTREPHNNLLVSILNLFGDERKTFGDPMYCTGPLPGVS
jgi:hypothetical protein